MPPTHPNPKDAGFALLITITLLAFLVLLLVALSSMTRVETQVAANSQAIMQARQNALMALNIAIGQLQQYAGPDQRVTATADLAAGNTTGAAITDGATPANTASVNTVNNTLTSVPNGMSIVQPGTRYWTGVWGNSDSASSIYTQTPDPVLLNWLVSGNEKTTFTQPGLPTGQITASDGGDGTVAPASTPALATNLSPQSNALSTNLTLGSASAVLLVGSQTVATNGTPSAADLDHYVVVPLVNISSSQIPGLTGSPTIGRYAWWVGDEGVKARYNLVDAYAVAGHTNTATDIDALYRLLDDPRAGVELLGAYGNYPLPSASATLAPILTLNQAGLLDSTLSPVMALQGSYYDLTTCSLGLLTDSQRGGLRQDLTALFDDSTQFPIIQGAPVIPAAYSPKLVTGVANTNNTASISVPQWDVVKSFHDLASQAITGSVAIQPATTTQMGISPIISQVRLLFGMRTPTASPSTTAGSVVFTVNPLIVLANPYPVTLTAPAGAVSITFGASPTNTTSGFPSFTIDGVSIPPAIFASTSSSSSLLTGVTFTFPAISIPGGAVAYYVGSVQQNESLSGTRSVQLSAVSGYPAVFAGAEFPSACSSSNISNFPTTTSPAGTHQISLLVSGSLFGITADLSLNGTNLQRIDRNEFYNTGWNGGNGASQGMGQAGAMPILQASGSGTNGWEHDNTFAIAQYVMQVAYPYQAGAEYSTSLEDATTGSYYIKNIGMRVYQDFNLRSAFFCTPGATLGTASPAASAADNASTSTAVLWNTMPPYFPYYVSAADITTPGLTNSSATATLPTVFTQDTTPPLWGQSNLGPATQCVLFDLPRADPTSNQVALFSIGQLQHVNLSADDDYYNEGDEPAYIAGNSYSTAFVARNLSVQPRDENGIPGSGDTLVTYLSNRNYYDMSYLVNSSLWDTYFFSTVPRSSTAKPVTTAVPLNNRLVVLPDPNGNTAVEELNYAEAAEVLGINGAFNINSTSVAAWEAVIGGTKSLPQLPVTTESVSVLPTSTAVYPRGLYQPGVSTDANDVTNANAFNGFRRLTPTQITSLAQAIVQQVRMRGPFLSLAQFINRTLVSVSNDTYKVGLSGPLQAAIDGTGLNQASATITASDQMKIGSLSDRSAFDSSTGGVIQAGAVTMFADSVLRTNATYQPDQGYRSTSVPGWLTQADMLQMLGPVLSARSDTFTIRTYGDVLNPVTQAVKGRAWCEAVVQRMPQYVNPATTSSALGDPATAAPATLLNIGNQIFGRRFKIVSFRWLSPNDI